MTIMSARAISCQEEYRVGRSQQKQRFSQICPRKTFILCFLEPISLLRIIRVQPSISLENYTRGKDYKMIFIGI